LGLDVKAWIDARLVDYVCPSYFGPTLGDIPRTEEFVALAKGSPVGIYPTVSSQPKWAAGAEVTSNTQRRLQNEICREALIHYDKGADGVSLYNWWPHHQIGMVAVPFKANGFANSPEFSKVLMHVCGKLGSREEVRACLKDGNWRAAAVTHE
jgi:hypothetical protein